MGIIRIALQALLFFGGVLLLTFVAVCLWTWLWPDRAPENVVQSDAIICLGAGVDETGALDAAANKRLETCIMLYQAGVAPRIVFSSGAAILGAKSGAETMAEIAIEAGVPESAVVEERRSQSTLQNALFSMDLLRKADHVTLVSEAFHLPRSKLAFLWAGAERVDLVMSEPVRRSPPPADRPQYIVLAREALAIWFNTVRTGVYSVAGWFGIPREERIDWLY